MFKDYLGALGGRMERKPLITIDGPAGAGKSTVGRILAEKLSCIYLDTGALYRALAWQAHREGIRESERERIADLCKRIKIRLNRVGHTVRILSDGVDITEEIRTEAIGMLASTLSAFPAVRAALLSIQRDSGKDGGLIAEGRDMGTVVFPEADFKFFLDAEIDERVRRRSLDLAACGGGADYEALKQDLIARDKQDRERLTSPLKVPVGAIVVDSTKMSVDAVVSAMLLVIAGK